MINPESHDTKKAFLTNPDVSHSRNKLQLMYLSNISHNRQLKTQSKPTQTQQQEPIALFQQNPLKLSNNFVTENESQYSN